MAQHLFYFSDDLKAIRNIETKQNKNAQRMSENVHNLIKNRVVFVDVRFKVQTINRIS